MLENLDFKLYFKYQIRLGDYRVVRQKQVSRAATSNYIPQCLWDVITCPCPWYLLLAPKSSCIYIFQIREEAVRQTWKREATVEKQKAIDAKQTQLEEAIKSSEILKEKDAELGELEHSLAASIEETRELALQVRSSPDPRGHMT